MKPDETPVVADAPLISGCWIHQIQEILAEHEPCDLIFQVSSQPGAREFDGIRALRRHDASLGFPERMAIGQRFRVSHVERRPAQEGRY
jgi:hypothetical protein